MKNIKYYFIFIVVITFVVYSSVFKNDFVSWDDKEYIYENKRIQEFSKKNIKYYFSHQHMGNYHPFTMLSYMFDYKTDKYNPKIYHLHNLILHIFNTLLVFWFIYLLVNFKNNGNQKKKQKYKIQNITIPFITSLLFGISTIHTESVVWAAERKDVLYTFYFLLSIIFYLKYLKQKKITFYVFSVFLFIFSLLSKGQAVALAVSLLAIDFFLQRRLLSKKVIIEKIPFFILALLFGIIAVESQDKINVIELVNFNLFDRITNSTTNFYRYIYKIILPINLSSFYPYYKITNIYYLFPAAFFVMIFFVIRKHQKINKLLIFCLLFFVINIILLLQILPVGLTIIADRYIYVSSIAIFLAIAFAYNWIKEKKRKYLLLSKIVLIVYIAFFSYLTFERTKTWNNSLSLWNDVEDKYKDTPVIYKFRGISREEAKDFKGALSDYNKAIELNPDYYEVYNNRGNIKKILGDFKGATNDYNKTIELNPHYFRAYYNRGNVKAKLNNYKAAIIDYDKAIQNFKPGTNLMPDLIFVYENKAYANLILENYDECIKTIKELHKIGGDMPKSFYDDLNKSINKNKPIK